MTSNHEVHYGLPRMILAGLGQIQVYAGTVPEAEIARRRAANKRARRSRRVNRMAARR